MCDELRYLPTGSQSGSNRDCAGDWRVLAGIEGLTGILLVGWSTAFVFAVVNRMYVGVRQETRRAQIRDLRRW